MSTFICGCCNATQRVHPAVTLVFHKCPARNGELRNFKRKERK